MELPKKVEPINNETMMTGIIAIAFVFIIVSFGSCTNRDNQIAADERIKLAELKIEQQIQNIDPN